MELNKYKNDGWGLSIRALSNLLDILNNMTYPINVIDFGSGHSTQFLYDYKDIHSKDISIDSFDDSKEYMHPKATLVPLIECSNKHFDKMMSKKELLPNVFKLRTNPVTTRQRNCFYDLSNIKLNKYDLVILDGPNGNGRSLAFLHLIGRLNEKAIVVIDDTTASDSSYQYNFSEIFNSIFDAEELVSFESINDSFKIFRVKGLISKERNLIMDYISRTILFYKYRFKRIKLWL